MIQLAGLPFALYPIENSYRWSNINTLFSLQYAFNASFCDDAAILIRGGWPKITCANIKNSVRNALDIWEQNTLSFVFEEVTHNASAHIRIAVGSASEYGDYPNIVAFTNRWVVNGTSTLVSAKISFNPTHCFMLDTFTCRLTGFGVNIIHEVLFIFVTIAGVVALLYFAFRFVRYRVKTPVSILVLTLSFALSSVRILLLATPCFNCHDFSMTSAHEVGHAIGLDHIDEENELCGCGAALRACNASSVNSIMRSTLSLNNPLCLTQLDADNLHRHYGDRCDLHADECHWGNTPGYVQTYKILIWSAYVSMAIGICATLIAQITSPDKPV